MKLFLQLLLLTLLYNPLFSQGDILENYVQEGLTNNETLKQKLAQIEKSITDYSEAKGQYLPSAIINSRYTVANGGRVIDFPIRDIFEGYSAYNNLSVPEGIENEQINLVRPKEQETKLEVSQAIFDMRLIYNILIKKDLVNISKTNTEIYKRYLVAEIKKAYFNYLKTLKIIRVYDEAKLLTDENLRVNKSLFQNDKVTIDKVYQAEIECSKNEIRKAEAIKNNQVSRAYFNFLLNRPTDSEIIEDETFNDHLILPSLDSIANQTQSSSDELKLIGQYIKTQDKNIKLQKSNSLPMVFANVNYGYQGEQYQFTNDYDVFMASLVLRWNIFNGFQNKRKVQRSKIEKSILESQYSDLEDRLKLDVINIYYDIEASEKTIVYNEKTAATSKINYEFVSKRYKEGLSNQIEIIDALTNKTNAEENLVLTLYDYYIKWAEYERIAGLYPIAD